MLESPVGTLSDVEAGAWPGDYGRDTRVTGNAPYEVWEAVGRGAWPWLEALDLPDTQHGWPARASLSPATWLATSLRAGRSHAVSPPGRLRPDSNRRRQQRTKCLLPYSMFLTAGPPMRANGSMWPTSDVLENSPQLLTVYDSAQPWRLPGGLSATDALYALQNSLESPAYGTLADRLQTLGIRVPDSEFASDADALDGRNMSDVTALAFHWPGPGAARRDPLRVEVDVRAATLMSIRARVATGTLVPVPARERAAPAPGTEAGGEPWRRRQAQAGAGIAEAIGASVSTTVGAANVGSTLGSVNVSYDSVRLPGGQMLVFALDGVETSTAAVASRELSAADTEPTRMPQSRALQSMTNASYRWEITDRRVSPLSAGIAILPPARKPPALPAPRLLSGLTHETVLLRVDGIATNDGGSPI